jgi:hypothetical protein
MHRVHPELFDKTRGMIPRSGPVQPEEVYQFASGCIKQGRPELAAVAVICSAWLQRPRNGVAGLLSWPDYKKWPHAMRIEHHKDKALVWHPFEETVDGEVVKF